MKIFHTQDPIWSGPDETLWVYNGLDVCITKEIWETLQPMRDAEVDLVYGFEIAMLAPALEMSLRGMLTDPDQVSLMIHDLNQQNSKLEHILHQYTSVFQETPLNPRSPVQVKNFFFKTLGLKEVKVIVQGKWQPSTNREALEKLRERELIAKPFVNLILAIRDTSKLISTLKTKIDPGRS